MSYLKLRTFSALLALAVSAPLLGGCALFAVPTDSSAPNGPTEITIKAGTRESTDASESAAPDASEAAAAKTPEEKTVTDTDYVRLMDDVKPEMMNPGFWIKDTDHSVLMSPEEIEQFNKTNRKEIKASDKKTAFPLLDEFGDKLDGKILKTFLKDNEKSVPVNPAKYYLNGKPTTASYWKDLVSRSNIDAVPKTINVKFGFTTKRMTSRLFPTEDRVFEDKSDKLFDSLIFSECMPYVPVVVLHESKDGDYLYCVFDSFAAWVRKDAVALCKDKNDWLSRQSADKWLVVTGREIRLGNDPYSSLTSNLVLPMGTKMELVPASKAPETVSRRTTYCDYIVKVPARGNDGYIKDCYVLIPCSDDVNAGFLPLTSENVIRLLFKRLGDRYGWAGDLKANDCTGITREIYKCFGVLLPRTGQSDCKGVYKVDMSKMSSDKKLEVINNLAPGSLISFPGHMTIYLGTVDGRPYVISAVGTFVAPAPAAKTVLHPRSVVLSSLYVRTSKNKTWLDISTTALTLKAEE